MPEEQLLPVSDYDFNLPQELIALHPTQKRDHSRLLVLDKNTGHIEHKKFFDITNYLTSKDLLVLNDTKVIPARLFGQKENTKGNVEIFLLKEKEPTLWECLVKFSGKIKAGQVIFIGEERISVELVDGPKDSVWLVRFAEGVDVHSIMHKYGQIPLPPYVIKQKEENAKKAKELFGGIEKYDEWRAGRYQTMYAQKHGATAAPTAGLHFTDEIFEKLKNKKVQIDYLTLHTGLATFRPVKAEYIEEHKMTYEDYEISEKLAEKIKQVKKDGGRVVAVGTTTVRALEGNIHDNGELTPGIHRTKVFIYPGFQFKLVDVLMTNFHLPRSTLLMLISAFAGKEKIFNAYREAIENKYRFFSFGDGMLIV